MKYSLTFGRTSRPADYESVKVEYTQEFDDEIVPREAAYSEVRNFVLGKIEEELSIYAEKYVKATEKAEKELSTYAEEYVGVVKKKPEAPHGKAEEGEPLEHYYPQVERLVWRAFKEKRPADPDEDAWTFANAPGAEGLVDLLRREGAAFMRMGGHRFLCKLSGKENQFINRTPQEKKEEKR